MSVTVKDHTASIERDLTQKASIFLRLFSEEVVKIATPKTPKKTGRLRADVLKQVLGLKGVIRWTKKYAIFQEVKRFKNYTTGGTGPGFAESSIMKAISISDKIARKAGLK